MNAGPTRPTGPRARAAVICAGVAAAAIVLAIVDPAATGLFGRCPVLWTTGFLCAGCGALRAAHALLRGDIGQALAYNLMALVTAPIISLWWLGEVAYALTGRRRAAPPRVAAPFGRALVVVLVAYAILRNVPVPELAFMRPHRRGGAVTASLDRRP